MTIQRKYEWLGVLYERDALSKVAIDTAFTNASISPDDKEYLLMVNYSNPSAFLNTGCGIPGFCYRSFMDQFEKLDMASPYDNGLSFKDVTSIEYETSRKGSAIQLRFISQSYDSPYRIVGFAAVESKEGFLTINKGWEMKDPFTIG